MIEMFDPRLSRGKLIRCKVCWSRRCPARLSRTQTWCNGASGCGDVCSLLPPGCTDRKWGEEVMKSTIIGLSVEFCSNSSKRRWSSYNSRFAWGGENLNPALFLLFPPKALCFFMLMMTIAWHRDLVQTGKV